MHLLKNPVIRILLINIPILACCSSVAAVLYGCSALSSLKPKLHDPELGATPSMGLTAEAVPYGIKLQASASAPSSSVYGIFDLPTESSP